MKKRIIISAILCLLIIAFDSFLSLFMNYDYKVSLDSFIGDGEYLAVHDNQPIDAIYYKTDDDYKEFIHKELNAECDYMADCGTLKAIFQNDKSFGSNCIKMDSNTYQHYFLNLDSLSITGDFSTFRLPISDNDYYQSGIFYNVSANYMCTNISYLYVHNEIFGDTYLNDDSNYSISLSDRPYLLFSESEFNELYDCQASISDDEILVSPSKSEPGQRVSFSGISMLKDNSKKDKLIDFSYVYPTGAKLIGDVSVDDNTVVISDNCFIEAINHIHSYKGLAVKTTRQNKDIVESHIEESESLFCLEFINRDPASYSQLKIYKDDRLTFNNILIIAKVYSSSILIGFLIFISGYYFSIYEKENTLRMVLGERILPSFRSPIKHIAGVFFFGYIVSFLLVIVFISVFNSMSDYSFVCFSLTPAFLINMSYQLLYLIIAIVLLMLIKYLAPLSRRIRNL